MGIGLRLSAPVWDSRVRCARTALLSAGRLWSRGSLIGLSFPSLMTFGCLRSTPGHGAMCVGLRTPALQYVGETTTTGRRHLRKVSL